MKDTELITTVSMHTYITDDGVVEKCKATMNFNDRIKDSYSKINNKDADFFTVIFPDDKFAWNKWFQTIDLILYKPRTKANPDFSHYMLRLLIVPPEVKTPEVCPLCGASIKLVIHFEDSKAKEWHHIEFEPIDEDKFDSYRTALISETLAKKLLEYKQKSITVVMVS